MFPLIQEEIKILSQISKLKLERIESQFNFIKFNLSK